MIFKKTESAIKQSRKKRLPLILSFSITVGLVWTLLLIGFFSWSVKNVYIHTQDLSLNQARAFFQEIVTTRLWNAGHGGVYVPITKETQPNPYLDADDRIIETKDGLALTKINAAYMTRQIAEISLKKNLFWFHITSATPIRPENIPDTWESEALTFFSKGGKEFNQFVDSDGEKLYRYMAPLWVESECLKCHAEQGFEQGDLRGGISVNIKAASIIKSQNSQINDLIIIYGVIWILGLIGLFFSYKRLTKEEHEREKVIGDLKTALEEV